MPNHLPKCIIDDPVKVEQRQAAVVKCRAKYDETISCFWAYSVGVVRLNKELEFFFLFKSMKYTAHHFGKSELVNYKEI